MTPSITNEINFVKYIVKKEDIMLQIRITNIYNFVAFKTIKLYNTYESYKLVIHN